MKLHNLFENTEGTTVASLMKMKGKTILLKGEVRDEWNGDFGLYLHGKNVTSWYGCPKRIDGYLNANSSAFTSWENAPEYAKKMYLNLENINSLVGIPAGEEYRLCNSPTKNLKGLPGTVKDLELIGFKRLTSLEGLDKITGTAMFALCDSLDFPLNLTNAVELNKIHIEKCSGLTNLKGIDKTFGTTESFYICDCENIKSNILGLLNIKKLKRVEAARCGKQFEKAVKIINKYLPGGDLLDCQDELMEAGLGAFAKL